MGARKRRSRPRKRYAATDLTPRERQIVGLIAEHKTNKEIGRKLGIAEYTVKSHVHKLLGKLGVRTRTQAASAVFGKEYDTELESCRQARETLEAALSYSYLCDSRILQLEWTLKQIVDTCCNALRYLEEGTRVCRPDPEPEPCGPAQQMCFEQESIEELVNAQ